MSKKEMLKESLNLHSQLNPKLFDKNSVLKPEIWDRLLTVTTTFISDLREDGVPLKVYDIWLLGSNAAYNYSPDSDIDIHLIVNFDDIEATPELVQLLYDYAKSSYNNKYDIKVKGHPVEFYIEDMNATAISDGIYSIKNNKWIKVPTPREDSTLMIEETPEYKEWQDRYYGLGLNKERIEKFIDDIYMLRKESLATDGEFGVGNLIFKEFRKLGRLDALKDKLADIKSKELSLENLDESALLRFKR